MVRFKKMMAWILMFLLVISGFPAYAEGGSTQTYGTFIFTEDKAVIQTAGGDAVALIDTGATPRTYGYFILPLAQLSVAREYTINFTATNLIGNHLTFDLLSVFDEEAITGNYSEHHALLSKTITFTSAESSNFTLGTDELQVIKNFVSDRLVTNNQVYIALDITPEVADAVSTSIIDITYTVTLKSNNTDIDSSNAERTVVNLQHKAIYTDAETVGDVLNDLVLPANTGYGIFEHELFYWPADLLAFDSKYDQRKANDITLSDSLVFIIRSEDEQFVDFYWLIKRNGWQYEDELLVPERLRGRIVVGESGSNAYIEVVSRRIDDGSLIEVIWIDNFMDRNPVPAPSGISASTTATIQDGRSQISIEATGDALVPGNYLYVLKVGDIISGIGFIDVLPADYNEPMLKSDVYTINTESLLIENVPHGLTHWDFITNIVFSLDTNKVLSLLSDPVVTGNTIVLDYYTGETFTFTIVLEGEEAPNYDLELYSTVYQVDNANRTISNIPYGTAWATFRSNLTRSHEDSMVWIMTSIAMRNGSIVQLVSADMTTFITYTLHVLPQVIEDTVAPVVTNPTVTIPSRDLIVTINGIIMQAAKQTTELIDGKEVSVVTMNTETIKAMLQDLVEKIRSNSVQESLLELLIADRDASSVIISMSQEIFNSDEETFISLDKGDVKYVLSSQELSSDRLKSYFGDEELTDIQITISIEKIGEQDLVGFVDNLEGLGKTLIIQPVSFEITATGKDSEGNDKEIVIDTFESYVDRIIELPADTDLTLITSGIVINADGSFENVPVEVYEVDGIKYAKIRSLTNSIYTVLSNPVTLEQFENHWARDVINSMASKFIITELDTFSPDAPLTRLQFTTYASRYMGIVRPVGDGLSLFKDIDFVSVGYEALHAAKKFGLVRGYTSSTFNPEQLITVEEALTIVSRMMSILKLQHGEIKPVAGNVSNWARKDVERVINSISIDLLKLVDFKGTLTHAEALSILSEIPMSSQ